MKKTFKLLAALLAMCVLLTGVSFAEDAPPADETAQPMEETVPVEESEPELSAPADEELEAAEEVAPEEENEPEAPELPEVSEEGLTDDEEEAEAPEEASAEEVPAEEETPAEEEAPPEEAEEIAEDAETASGDFEIINSVLLKYNGTDEEVVVPKNIKAIGDKAFYDNDYIKKVTLPDGLESIGDAAFADTKLAQINLPSTVKTIGASAFYCTDIVSITIPRAVTVIDSMTFYYCEKLTTVNLPSTIKEIKWDAFYGCSTLSSLTLPSGLTTIGNNAFSDCEKLSLKLPDTVTEIGAGVFSGCKALKSITIPKKVKSLGESYSWSSGVFEDCTYLKTVVIQEGVQEICGAAFKNCYGLTSIRIPRTVTSIGDDAFERCYDVRISGYKESYARQYAEEHNIAFIALEDSAPTVEAISVSPAQPERKKPATFTVTTSSDAKYIALYAENGYKVKSWSATGNAVASGDKLVWTVQYTFANTGNRQLVFRACANGNGIYGYGKTCSFKVIPQVLDVVSASANVGTAECNERITFTVVTPKDATYVALYTESGSKVKVWKHTYYAEESNDQRVWTLTYSIANPGSRSLTFRCSTGGAYGAGKTVNVKVTISVEYVDYDSYEVAAKQAVTFYVWTPTSAKYLALYAENGAKVKVWSRSGNSVVEDGYRVWTVQYAIANKGNRVLTFKCSADGTYGEGYEAELYVY